MDKDKLLSKLEYEAMIVEDLVFAFAEENKFTEFASKWGKKPYSDSDHTLYHMVGDFLEQIKVKLK
jgi:hypothetical protein